MRRFGFEHLGADPRGAGAVLHDVNNRLMTVASLVIHSREALDPVTDREPRRLLEELGSVVGETIRLARGEARRSDPSTFQPASYVLEHVAALAGLFDCRDRFSVTLHPACTGARIHMQRTDLLRVLTHLVRSAEQVSARGTSVELDLDLIEASHPIPLRGLTVPAGAYFCFRISDRGPDISDPPGPGSDGPDGASEGAFMGRDFGLSVASRLLAEVGGGLRASDREGSGVVVEAILPTHPKRP